MMDNPRMVSAESRVDWSFAVSRWKKALMLALCFAGGMLYAAALPPLNWSPAVFFCLIPLFYCGIFYQWKFRLLAGWLWGLGWSLFAYNFLREIHPAVPFMLAPVISLWPAVYMLLLGWVADAFITRKNLTAVPRQLDIPVKGALLYLASAAMLFTVIEWTRCYLFVWNDFSVTLWQMPVFMQIARITGRYGTSLAITLINAAIFSLLFCTGRRVISGILLIFPLICLLYGIWRLTRQESFEEAVLWKCALIQGNLPQQRQADAAGIKAAVDIYTGLSRSLKNSGAETVIWPECAVPIPLLSSHPLGKYYRDNLASLKQQMLIGTLNFNHNGDMTNGVLLISADSKLMGKYDKFHRVPYGEYVPFRNWLPESWINAFSMGRDLAAGEDIQPLQINDMVRAGTAVCYEGVFSYLSAGFALNGANVLAAVSNDVWYPESSEPEQHLANAVMRSVETGLPMIRCGNNGGSGVVTPEGIFTNYIGTPSPRPELLREQAAGVVEVMLEKNPPLTPAVRFFNWIVYLQILLLLTAFLFFSRYRITGK